MGPPTEGPRRRLCPSLRPTRPSARPAPDPPPVPHPRHAATSAAQACLSHVARSRIRRTASSNAGPSRSSERSTITSHPSARMRSRAESSSTRWRQRSWYAAPSNSTTTPAVGHAASTRFITAPSGSLTGYCSRGGGRSNEVSACMPRTSSGEPMTLTSLGRRARTSRSRRLPGTPRRRSRRCTARVNVLTSRRPRSSATRSRSLGHAPAARSTSVRARDVQGSPSTTVTSSGWSETVVWSRTPRSSSWRPRGTRTSRWSGRATSRKRCTYAAVQCDTHALGPAARTSCCRDRRHDAG